MQKYFFSAMLRYIRSLTFMMRSFFFFFLLLPAWVCAQTDTVKLQGVVFDIFTRKPLGGVSIINPKSGINTMTDLAGKFISINLQRDTLFLFSPGYRTAKFSVADSVWHRTYELALGMEPLSTGLSQAVIIRAPKTLEEIEEQRKRLGITPRELERPEISFTSPISALYELLSNKAREREKLKTQIVEIDREKIFKELLRYYIDNGLIDLPEDHFDAFDKFCGYTINYLKGASDYEISSRTVDLFNRYARWNGLIK